MERVRPLGKPSHQSQRPVILKLMDYREKQLTLQNGRKLRDTCISTGEDFSFRVRSIRKRFFEELTFELAKGRKDFFLSYDELSINQNLYIWDYE